MASSSGSLHEAADQLGPELIDRHRAIVSIMEELEAIDWYDQRVAAATDPELAGVLAHNRDEEKEHAAMTLEWLRRRDPVLDEQLRSYLFTSSPVLEVEVEAAAGGDVAGSAEPGRAPGAGHASTGHGAAGGDGSLGIGGLKGASAGDHANEKEVAR